MDSDVFTLTEELEIVPWVGLILPSVAPSKSLKNTQTSSVFILRKSYLF